MTEQGELLARLHGDGRRFVKQEHLRAGVATDPVNRQADDFYETPSIATEELLVRETFDGAIWECACGRGAISSVLSACGHEVVSTDLVDRGYGAPRIDFLMEYRSLAPNIVTNPPFKNTAAFITKALDLAPSKVAMFLKLTYLEGQERGLLYRTRRPKAVYVFSRRLNVWRNGIATSDAGGVIGFMWVVWDEDRARTTTAIDWIE